MSGKVGSLFVSLGAHRARSGRPCSFDTPSSPSIRGCQAFCAPCGRAKGSRGVCPVVCSAEKHLARLWVPLSRPAPCGDHRGSVPKRVEPEFSAGVGGSLRILPIAIMI